MKKRRTISPYLQGDHDALCGLYAILNCLRLCLSDLSLSHSFYHDLMEYLVWSDRDHAADYLVRGLSIADVERSLQAAKRYLHRQLARPLIVRRPFEHARNVHSENCLDQIAQQVSRPAWSCIIALGHKHYAYHWSVAEEIAPKSIKLADSCNDRSVKRARLKAEQGRARATSAYCWMPRASFLVAVAEPGYVRV